jgi:hypothetical protein
LGESRNQINQKKKPMKENKKNGSKNGLKRESNLQRAAVEIMNDVDGLS